LEQNIDLLTNRLLGGERAAAEELVDKFYQQIYLFFRRMGHSPQTSEDLTEECFIHIWQNTAHLKYERALVSWIYSIAGNISRTYWRKNKRYVSLDSGLEIIDSSQQGPSLIEHNEELAKLKKMILLLPFKQRQVIVLHYFQKLAIGDCAEAAGVGKGTLKSRLNRALRFLRKKME